HAYRDRRGRRNTSQYIGVGAVGPPLRLLNSLRSSYRDSSTRQDHENRLAFPATSVQTAAVRRMLLAIAIVPALSLGPLPAWARPPPSLQVLRVAGHRSETQTSVIHDCIHARIEPRGIIFACADLGFYSDHLHWRKWHKFRAVGEGEFHGNDCRP